VPTHFDCAPDNEERCIQGSLVGVAQTNFPMYPQL
jgi:hypothetical protein